MTERRGRPLGPPELRKFGFVMAAAWSVVGALLWWRSRAAAPYLLALAAVFLASAIIWPRALAPIERIWMKFANVLSIVMTTVILTLTFYLVITPMGLLLRLLGKDLLALRPDPRATSFWVPTEPDGPATRADKPF